MTKRTRSKITKGKHTTFVHHSNGVVEMITDWDALALEINKAIESWKKSNKPVKTKPLRV
jgi:hypothetical protein